MGQEDINHHQSKHEEMLMLACRTRRQQLCSVVSAVKTLGCGDPTSPSWPESNRVDRSFPGLQVQVRLGQRGGEKLKPTRAKQPQSLCNSSLWGRWAQLSATQGGGFTAQRCLAGKSCLNVVKLLQCAELAAVCVGLISISFITAPLFKSSESCI